jgi:hypothetical protein
MILNKMPWLAFMQKNISFLITQKYHQTIKWRSTDTEILLISPLLRYTVLSMQKTKEVEVVVLPRILLFILNTFPSDYLISKTWLMAKHCMCWVNHLQDSNNCITDLVHFKSQIITSDSMKLDNARFGTVLTLRRTI